MWVASVFRLGGTGITVELTTSPPNPPTWAVRQAGMALSRSGLWDYEPLPSSRTEEWLSEHRWPTLPEAQKAAEEYIERVKHFGPETQRE